MISSLKGRIITQLEGQLKQKKLWIILDFISKRIYLVVHLWIKQKSFVKGKVIQII